MARRCSLLARRILARSRAPEMGPDEYRSKYASKACEARRPRALASVAAQSGAAAAATLGPAFECRAAPRTPCGLTRATTRDSASSPRRAIACPRAIPRRIDSSVAMRSRTPREAAPQRSGEARGPGAGGLGRPSASARRSPSDCCGNDYRHIWSVCRASGATPDAARRGKRRRREDSRAADEPGVPRVRQRGGCAPRSRAHRGAVGVGGEAPRAAFTGWFPRPALRSGRASSPASGSRRTRRVRSVTRALVEYVRGTRRVAIVRR